MSTNINNPYNIAGKPVQGGVPANLEFIRFNFANNQWEFVTVATGGEVNLGANVGSGVGLVFRDKTGVTLNFKRLIQGANITLTNGADDITIAGPAPGETNLGANVGSGVGLLFRDKTGVTLNIKRLIQGANITLTNGADDVTIAAASPTANTFARVVKKVDEVINTTATLHDDVELKVTLNINKIYSGILLIYLQSVAAAGFKWSMSVPAGATGRRKGGGTTPWESAGMGSTVDIAATNSNATDNNIQCIELHFKIVMAGTAGDFVFRWAQSTSNAGDTKVLVGSLLVIYEET